MKKYYDILGLNIDASQKEIEEAYNKLSVELNPKNNNNEDFFKVEYLKIVDAYNAISNKSKLGTTNTVLSNRSSDAEINQDNSDEEFITIKVPINKLNEDQGEYNSDQVSPNQPLIKKRHGCVTTWLVLMLISNLFAVLINFNAGLSILAFLGLLGIVSTVFLFQWSKKGFFLFTLIAVVAFMLNLSYQVPIGTALMGLFSPIVLWAIFQFKSNDVSAWDNLE